MERTYDSGLQLAQKEEFSQRVQSFQGFKIVWRLDTTSRLQSDWPSLCKGDLRLKSYGWWMAWPKIHVGGRWSYGSGGN